MSDYKLLHRNKIKGFILLHTLWFLLLIALLLGITLEIGRRTTWRLIIEKHQIERELSEESAINDVLFEVIEYGLKPVVERSISLNGQDFLVTITPSHGLVDFNTGKPVLLQQVAIQTSVDSNRMLSLRLTDGTAKYTILSYADLTEKLNLTDQQFACLYPYVTLFSGRHQPFPQYMPIYLKSFLGNIRQEDISVISSNNVFSSGDSLRIDVKPFPMQSTGYYLSAEIILTGRMDMPFFIRTWQHLPICQK